MYVAGPFSFITFAQRKQKRVNSWYSYRPWIGCQAPAWPRWLDQESKAMVPEYWPPSSICAAEVSTVLATVIHTGLPPGPARPLLLPGIPYLDTVLPDSSLTISLKC